MDNEIQTQFPILSYVLSTLDPNSHPPQLSQTLIQYPHLSNPTLLSSLAQFIPPTTPQSLTLLRSLGPLPDPESVSSARSKLTQMEKTGENSKEAEIYKAVVRMEEMQLGYRKKLEEAEEMLLGAYSEGVKELEGGCVVDGVVEAMLKEVENDGVVERLDLSGRQLRLVPEAFGWIGGLVVLKLSRNQLEILPDSIDGLGKLEELDVSSNLLWSLPDSIGLLHKLKVLHVSGNKLTALPESIALCSSLVELDASFNNLVCLPTNFGCGLGNLEQLSIQLNKIRLLPPSICEMKSLRYLDAHFNEIHGLPSAIGRLTNLEVLNLSSNFSDLTELPETTSDLVNLRVLDLSNNQIRALPNTFGRLENLIELNLDENPLIIPPREIVNKGVQAVREFMAKRWQDMIAEEQQRHDLQANQEQPQTGWLAWGTGLLNNFVSGVSERVSGYLGGAKTPIDPHLDQQL